MTSTPDVIDNDMTPISGKIRIQALDVIRGLSVLGILAVNADGYSAPQAASLHPQTWIFPNTHEISLCYWVMDTFFHEKFITLFSMLFGVSLFLVGGERSDKARGAILARRLVILFGFAMLHGFGIWWGDVLSLYATTGFLMFLCRSWHPRTLLMIGLALYLAVVASHSPMITRSVTTTSTQTAAKQSARSNGLEERKAVIARTLAEAKSSWAGAYRVNAREYLHLLAGELWVIPQTLGLMMMGLGLFKFGYLAGRSSGPLYALTVVISILALVVVGLLCWRADMQQAPVSVTAPALIALAPLVALGYAATLILLLRTKIAPAMTPLAATGRMAFTNYLSQSLIMTTIFYGGRGGLMGEVNRPGLWAITIVIWVLQLVWSPLWLSRFEMGPFEWIWRCLTLGRRVPLLKP